MPACRVPPVRVKEDTDFMPEKAAELLNVSTSKVISKIISIPPCQNQITIWSGLKYRNNLWLRSKTCTVS